MIFYDFKFSISKELLAITMTGFELFT